MTILLTGASGFIGGHLCALLSRKGHRVVPYDGDVTRLGDWKGNLKRKPEVIIHAAGVRTETEKDFAVNSKSLEKLSTALSDLPEKPQEIILVSTQAVYFGLTPPFEETMKVSPESTYAKSKYMGEIQALKIGRKYDIRTIILRLSATFGTGVRSGNGMSGPLSGWTRRSIRGQDIEVFQDGHQTRDYINVSDVASAVLLAVADRRARGIFNVGGRRDICLVELAGWIKEASKSKSKIVIKGGRESLTDPRRLYSDISKFEKLGWTPRKTARQAVNDFVKSML